MAVFEDRYEAGALLAEKLLPYKEQEKVLILGIPRGGVVTAKVISDRLRLPLDVIVTRKIGAPNQEELAIGAVGPEGVSVLDKELVSRLGIGRDYLKKKIGDLRLEIRDREKKFKINNLKLRLRLKTVILVDDGIATGATTEAAIKYLRKKKVKKIILVTPVAPRDSELKFQKLVDELVILETPYDFRAVGQFYRDFPQVSDEEVIQLLHD